MPHLISLDKGLRVRLIEVEPKGQEMELWCWAACSEMMVSYLRSSFGHGFSQVGQENPGQENPDPAADANNADIRQGAQANLRRKRRAAAAAAGKAAAQSEAVASIDDVDCSCAKNAGDYKACNENGWPDFFEFEAVAQSTEWSSYRFILEELGIPLRENGWPRTVVGGLSSWQLRDLVMNGGPDLYRRLFDAEDCALSWPMLQSLLDQQLPVVFGWRYPERGGHFMVATGYVITPAGEPWVVVLDPLPPNHGDWYLVPYEYWVAGPYGRHWRDWWVVPSTAPNQPVPPHYSIDHLRVGRELVRSELPVSNSLPAPSQRRNGSWLSDQEEAAAQALAEEGLDALKAIASQAPELAATLGMGGSILRLVLKGFILSFLESTGKSELAAKVSIELKAVSVDPKNLTLDKNYIPVFRLNASNLRDWDGDRPETLLTAPQQVVYRVERGDLTAFRFYSTITVERYDDGWRLASIGKSSLTSTLSTEQLFAVLGWTGEQAELSFEGLAQRLDELDLLETIAQLIPIAELDAMLALQLEAAGEDSSPADQELTAKLKALAAELRGMISNEKLDARSLKSLARKADRVRKIDPKPVEVELPKFAVDVGELYQLFIAYGDDQLESVYPSSFYPPDRRVSTGDKADVLRQLKRLAEKA